MLATRRSTSRSAPESAAEPGAGRGRWRGLSRWGLSIAATAASTWALDVVATAAGVLLALSAVLAGLGPPMVLALLGTSYVVWALALRVNLRANWDLLERTGISSNVVSKAAHGLAAHRTRNRRVHRIAAAAGYIATEVAKEVPYYAGAFGAALLSDAVSSQDAITFLIGANLGAAGYEYGLAGLTRVLLHRRYAAFETDWVPRDYLADYYREVEPDEHETIAFFVKAIQRAEPGQPILCYGVGPTLHHVFLAAGTSSEIHLGDYLPANLAEIQRWIERDPLAHDWSPFVRYTLQCEGIAFPSDAEVTRREDLTRSKITRLIEVDGRQAEPAPDQYATVISAYCADSATPDRATWASFMCNIVGQVRPGGLFVTAALRRSTGYAVGGKTFPSARVDEHDLRSVLERSWGPLRGSIEVRDLVDQPAHGYSGIVLAWAISRAAPALAASAGPDGGSRPSATGT